MENPKQETAPLAKRVHTINAAMGELFAAVMTLAAKGDEPINEEMETVLKPAFTLLNCGLIALTEIADAQQRLATSVERDLEAEIMSVAEAMAEDKARANHEAESSRSFIGQNRLNPLTPPA